MTEQITRLLNADFAAAVALIEQLPLVGSEGARSLQSSEWFDDANGAQFKVDYADGDAESVQIVGTMDVYHRP